MMNTRVVEAQPDAATRGSGGFTLVEVMVAITLFVAMAALAAMAQSNIGRASERALGLSALYRDAAGIGQRLRLDAEQRLATTPIYWNLTPGGQQTLIFMSEQPSGLGASGVHSPTFLGRQPRYHYARWICWTYTPNDGLLYGASPDGSTISSVQYNDRLFDYIPVGTESSMIGRTVRPVRQWKYFANLGDPEDPTSAQAEARVNRWFLMNASNTQAAYLERIWEVPQDILGYHYNGTWDDLSGAGTMPDYAAAMPPPHDGHDFGSGSLLYTRAYNKDRLFLFGANPDPDNIDLYLGLPHPEQTVCAAYPSQMAVLHHRIDGLSMRLRLSDGSTIDTGTNAVDGRHLQPGDYYNESGALPPITFTPTGNSAATLRTREDAINSARLSSLQQQPVGIELRYVIHDMPIDHGFAHLDQNASPESANYLLWEFYASGKVASGDQTAENLQRLIEARGHSAITICHAIPLP